ncbi:hypothetical protein, variant [Aphanomyces astaci]|uniref:Uncharacterized protein n=1 Tax=Aphanomyces astaci TaxID=112090 RepID=W4FT57_APHAT|nr:hypothetical protein, variant [Aphanomyces astaci]ETV70111.1 hypothetical protein, variant [Aphanomyces astaci]|eukprot:XP_009840554.1 hypothetical protein, variant [Aphanomyces astaci]
MDVNEAKCLLERHAAAQQSAMVQEDDGSIPNSVKEGTVRRAKQTVTGLVLLNVAMWVGTICISTTYPVILSPALVAYSLGLRHAVDADHIAAIDNVTRSLLQRGRQSVTVGLFFSLGHSSVVVLLSVVVVCSASAVNLDTSKSIGAIVGASVSATFLCLIGLVNAVSFVRLLQQWNAISPSSSQGGDLHDDDVLTPSGVGGGILASCCPSLLKVIDQPWKMYPLGFLFGLGFDTASEVALLAISALASQSGVPSWVVLVLPGLFACGMSLIDSLDGIFMLWAYGWAYIHPAKKLFYNMFLTGLSSFVALFIGAVEAVGILVARGLVTGWVADIVLGINDNFELLGCVVIGLFVVSFGISYFVYEVFFAAKAAAVPCGQFNRANKMHVHPTAFSNIMIVMVLSPAKTLDMSEVADDVESTQPMHLDDASELIHGLRKLSLAKVKTLLGVSDALAKLNYDRYKHFITDIPTTTSTSAFKQAVFSFDGPAYKGLQSASWTPEDLTFAQAHLRILCGLYGTLRPLDLIQAYRLEMGSKVQHGRGPKDGLYAFWGRAIADDINAVFALPSTAVSSSSSSINILLNVASVEYFKSVDMPSLDPSIVVVDCIFKDDGQIKSVFAKRARGLMVNYVVTSRAATMDHLRAFQADGYVYSRHESTDTQLVFNRSKAAAAAALKRAREVAAIAKLHTKRPRNDLEMDTSVDEKPHKPSQRTM